jgi:antitoxin (DNA-binding transcriptional repressor) of toxin-antitoxin stability system
MIETWRGRPIAAIAAIRLRVRRHRCAERARGQRERYEPAFHLLSLFERRRCDNASDLTASNQVIALP